MKKIILMCFLVLLLALSACKSEKEDFPKEEGKEEIGEESAEEINYEALEEKDASWWWGNYISVLSQENIGPYPSYFEGDNNYIDILNLMTYGLKNNMASFYESSGNIVITMNKEKAEEIAPLVLGKDDLSYLNTGYIEDENGNLKFNIPADILKINEGSKGNESYKITDVNYVTPYEPQITLESENIKRIYSFHQNKDGIYNLESISQTLKGERKTPMIKAETHHTIYDSNQIPSVYDLSNLLTAGLLDGKLIKYQKDEITGIAELYIYDEDDLTKAPLSTLIKLKKGEEEVNFTIKGNKIVMTSSSYLREFNCEGENVRTVSLSKHYKEERRETPKEIRSPLVFDESLNYISYSSPKGLFAEDLLEDEIIKIEEGNLSENSLGIYPVSIDKGILSYAKSSGESGILEGPLSFYDIKERKLVPPPFPVPKANDKSVFYKDALSSYSLGLTNPNLNPSSALEIFNEDSGEIFKIPKEYEGQVIYNSERLFILSPKNEEDSASGFSLYEVNLNDGSLKEPLAYLNVSSCDAFIDENMIIITYGGIEKGYSQGILALDLK